MSKKRPSQRRPPTPHPATVLPSKQDPAYWIGRLLSNTFTYQGRQRKVRGWAVKIQLFGQRKTFSLASNDPQTAAREACQIYQTLSTQGWEAVAGPRPWIRRRNAALQAEVDAPGQSDLEYWKPRLLLRRYPEPNRNEERELSVHLEHGGRSGYFPLGTKDKNQAAAEAIRIQQTILRRGWPAAEQEFSRELTLAFRWSDRPLIWTYTTLHTQPSGPAAAPRRQPARPAARKIGIIEPDAGLRLALMACVNGQKGFHCCSAHAGLTEALRDGATQTMDCFLVNDATPAQSSSGGLEGLRRYRPHSVGLLYSVFEDSDQLFLSTPGGVGVYLLTRTPPHRIFDPLEHAGAALTPELVSATVSEYFQRLVAPMPARPLVMEVARLTRREREILTLLAKGAPAKEIADVLRISIWTVQGHVKNIFEKLNVHTRTEAVVKFLQK